MSGKRRILMAVDGSDQSLSAVRYAGSTFPGKETEAVLFHVQTGIPEAFLDLRKEDVFRSSMPEISAWATQKKINIDAFMKSAVSVLSEAGFSKDAIKVSIQKKKKGVARDILDECRKGYDVILVGRTGVSMIQDLFIGSVANKLVVKSDRIPIVVVGGKPSPKKFVVGFDGSEGAVKAGAFVAGLVDPAGSQVRICYVIRRLEIRPDSKVFFSPKQEIQWIDERTKEMLPTIKKMEKTFIEAGFSSDGVFIEILDEQVSRAHRLVKEARSGGFHSVVTGRRGLSVVEEFFMGRVSTKVLQMGQDLAVWIV